MIKRQSTQSETSESKMSPANLLVACSRAFATAWWWLRQVTGDAAYDNYLHSSGSQPHNLSRVQFYRDSLRRKYSSINRCC